MVIALHSVQHARSIGYNMQILNNSLPKYSPTAESLASHIISKGSSQFGGWMIGADVTRLLSLSWASLHA